MSTQTRCFVLFIALTLGARAANAAPPESRTPPPAPDPPKLVLFIVVDQLRGDMPMRFHDRFGADGLRRLLDEGAWYANAHYRHAATFTGTGHAALFTGAAVGEHGICGNRWLDRLTGEQVYCVEDPRCTLLGEPTKKRDGTSPANLLCSTIGDELVLASAGRSRVFAVGGKDRSAILPAGRLGKAFWFSTRSGRFVTSTYYAAEEPGWLRGFNDARPAEAYRNAKWELAEDRARYLFASADDQPCEYSAGTLGRTFPHVISAADDPGFYDTLANTPMFDELTVTFIEALLEALRPGCGEATDLLSVSLSATDFIGHSFGPDSLEAEDNLIRLDRTIARLLAAIDKLVGLERTLVVLSSDHGVDSSPEYRYARYCASQPAAPRELQRLPGGAVQFQYDADPDAGALGAGRHYPEAFLGAINAALRREFKLDMDLAVGFANPSVYLDEPAILAKGLKLEDVERAAAEALLRLPGFAAAFTRSDLLAGRVPDTPIAKMILRSFHARRSGHLLLVQSPAWALYHDPTENTAMHGSPYAYDTHVPVVFRGPGVAARRIDRRVAPEDIACTLALYLGVCSPSGSTGEPLLEVLGGR